MLFLPLCDFPMRFHAFCFVFCFNIFVSNITTMDRMLGRRDVSSCSSGSRVQLGVKLSSGEGGVRVRVGECSE
jgi:hypothetical protein